MKYASSAARAAKTGLPYQSKGILTEGPVSGHLIRLSVPMVWGILAILSFQLVDTFYVSLLGTEELAALSFTFPVNYIVFSVIMGFSIAMSSVLSRLIGEGRRDDVRCVTAHGLMLAFSAGLVVAGLGIAFHDQAFRMMGADGPVLTMIREYMMIWFGGAVFLTLPMVGNAAIRAGGDTLVPALIMAVAAGINIILDPLLIFGLFGFPRMELEGAALATVFANGCAMLVGLAVLYRRDMLPSALRDLELEKFGNSARRLLVIALPAGLTNAVQPLANAVILALLAAYGPEAVAAYGVVSRLEAFAFVILMALSVGLAPIVGQNWGAGRYVRVHETLRLAIGFSVLWSVLTAAVFIVSGEALARLFSDDPALIRTALLFFWIVPPSYAFGNLILGWASAFNAMGMPQRSFAMIAIKTLVLTVPAIYAGEAVAGVPGIFAAIAAVNVIAGLGFHVLSWRACKAHETPR